MNDGYKYYLQAINEDLTENIKAKSIIGTIKANSDTQLPDQSILRNSKLVPEETDPVNNGEIYWIYE